MLTGPHQSPWFSAFYLAFIGVMSKYAYKKLLTFISLDAMLASIPVLTAVPVFAAKSYIKVALS